MQDQHGVGEIAECSIGTEKLFANGCRYTDTVLLRHHANPTDESVTMHKTRGFDI